MIIHDMQQNTPEWDAIRVGKPTSSEFAKLVTSKGDPSKQMPDYAVQLAADLYAGQALDRWEGNQWTERGHNFEDAARAFYENSFADRLVTRVGFITDDAELYGCSPDSLVDDDGLLEVKCLSARHHVKALMYYDKNQRLLPEYVVQPQGQMYIAERDWCDSLFWHPELPAMIVRNLPDEKIVINLRLQIMGCIDQRNRVLETLANF